MVIYFMNTSYFVKTHDLLNQGYTNLIAVSGYVPEFYSEQMKLDKRLHRCLELAPKKEWFFDWKQGKFNNDKYVELYYETVLNKLNAEELYEKLGSDAILLCYEKPNDFCHRHLIADWFNEKLKINVLEINFELNENIF